MWKKFGGQKKFAECAIRKYSGDDPDVTNGLLVFARVKRKRGQQILHFMKVI